MKPEHNSSPLIQKTYNVNGSLYHLLTDTQRDEIRQEIENKRKDVEYYLLNSDFKEPAQQVAAIRNSMKSFEWWCDHFCFTFDPRDMRDPHKRFILYPYQRKAAQQFIDAIMNGGTVLLDKSRDMGASWLSIAVITHCWLFLPSFHALLGSRKEALVEDKTVDSLFGKVDYILKRLPPWMLNGYDDTSKQHRAKLRVAHPQGNILTGESSNESFGRGPRKNLVYLDEFAFWENDKAVWTGVQDTAPCRIVTSTPYGESNQFGRIRFAGDDTRTLITMHWTQHPDKDNEWYEAQKKLRHYDTTSIAQELDIDYRASAGGLVLPQLQQNSALYRCPPIPLEHPSNQHARFYAGLDWGTRNPTSFHVYRVRKVQEVPTPRYEVVSMWEYYEPSTLEKCARAIKTCPYYDLIEKIYADPSMWFHTQIDDDKKAMTNLASLFLKYYRIMLHPGKRGDAYARTQLEMMWEDPENPLMKISHNCPEQWREWTALRYETQSSFMEAKKNTPEKMVDKDNHSWDDFKYFFNSHFSADYIEPAPSNIPMGYEALNKDISTLREKKLKGLQHQHRRRKRFF